jgi:hypothetical protein
MSFLYSRQLLFLATAQVTDFFPTCNNFNMLFPRVVHWFTTTQKEELHVIISSANSEKNWKQKQHENGITLLVDPVISHTKPQCKKLIVQCNDNWPKQNCKWKAETGEEAWQRVLCKMKVTHHKIKNSLCIHEDQQSVYVKQNKPMDLALVSKIDFEVSIHVWYQSLENMTTDKKESHPNRKTACIMHTLFQQ